MKQKRMKPMRGWMIELYEGETGINGTPRICFSSKRQARYVTSASKFPSRIFRVEIREVK